MKKESHKWSNQFLFFHVPINSFSVIHPFWSKSYIDADLSIVVNHLR